MSSKSHPFSKRLKRMSSRAERSVLRDFQQLTNQISSMRCAASRASRHFVLPPMKKRRKLCATTFRAWDCVPMFILCVTSTFLTFRAVRTSTSTQDLKFCSNLSIMNAMLQLRVLMLRHSLPFREMCLNSRLLNLKRAGSSHLKRRQRHLLCSATNALMR